MKSALYRLKLYIQSLYVYPKQVITDEPDHDYDAYWNERTGNIEGGLNSWQKDRADIITEKLKTKQDLTLVDVGCGNGDILARIHKEINAKKLIGIDISESALLLAEKNGIETIKADISEETNSLDKISEYDVVLFLEVLEHMRNPEKVLRIATENAKLGVFFSIPNTGFFTHRFRLLFGKAPMQWRLHPSEHLRFWTLRDTEWWLDALGYEKYEIIPYKGIPVLNFIAPSLFAAGLLVFIEK